MPGNQVKDWNLYHELRSKGKSKGSAARIANYVAARRRRKRLAKFLSNRWV